MKFAFSTLACPKWSTEQVIDNALNFGYDGIELRLIDGEVIDPVRDADKVKEMVTLSRARGLEVCAFDTSCRFNYSNPTERSRNVTELQNWIRLAQEMQVAILRVFGGELQVVNKLEASEQEQNAWVAESLQQVSQQAAQAQVIVALETHDAFSSARRVAEVLKMVDTPTIGALWDSHHPYRVGESAEEVLNLLGKRIAHVHIKDAFRVPESDNWQLVLVGEGEVPVREQLLLLEQSDYDGYISVEWEKRWHPEIADPEDALPHHIAWLKFFTGMQQKV